MKEKLSLALSPSHLAKVEDICRQDLLSRCICFEKNIPNCRVLLSVLTPRSLLIISTPSQSTGVRMVPHLCLQQKRLRVRQEERTDPVR